MYTDVGVICDAATSDLSGKLNMLGIFDQINSSQYPALSPPFAAVFRIIFDKDEDIPNKFKLMFLDKNAKSILPPLEVVSNQKITKCVDRRTFNLIVGINGIKIPTPGDFVIKLFFGGNLLKTINLFARKIVPMEGFIDQ